MTNSNQIIAALEAELAHLRNWLGDRSHVVTSLSRALSDLGRG